MSVKLLKHLKFLSLKGAGSSESSLVKMPHCWKSHVATQMHHEASADTIGGYLSTDSRKLKQ